MMLTAQQANLLNFIRFHQSEHDGVSPSYEQMKEALGLKSKSGISRLIEALVQRGFIRRRPHLARAIEVLERAVVTPSPVRLAPTDALIAEITARGFDVRRVA